MQNNLLIIIIIVGVIALILGAIAGYLGSFLENRLNKALDAAREITDPNDPKYAEQQEQSLHVMDHDILKVSVDARLQLKLSLDGVSLERDGLTAEQRTRLVNVLTQIRPWVEGRPVSAVPVAPPPPVDPKPIFSTPSSFPAPISNTQPPPPGRVDPRRGFLSLLESDVKKPEPLLKNNIISLIDEVLQKNLEGSPLAGKRIRLEEGPKGEVIVYVGLSRYTGIDSVPDYAIQDIIQKSIKEWNDK